MAAGALLNIALDPLLISAMGRENGVLGAALATVIAIRIDLSVAVMTAILTFILLIFGEITPKSVAAKYSEPVALFVSGIIYWLMWIFTPIIFIINSISSFILKPFGIDLGNADNPLTESELRTFVDVSHEDGVIEGAEKKILNNVVDFGDSRARERRASGRTRDSSIWRWT